MERGGGDGVVQRPQQWRETQLDIRRQQRIHQIADWLDTDWLNRNGRREIACIRVVGAKGCER